MKYIITLISCFLLTSCTSNLYLSQIGTDKLISTLVNYNKSKKETKNRFEESFHKADSLLILEYYENTSNIGRTYK